MRTAAPEALTICGRAVLEPHSQSPVIEFKPKMPARLQLTNHSKGSGSRMSAWVIPTNEELIIARHTGALLGLVEVQTAT